MEFVHIGNTRIVLLDSDLLLQSEMQAVPFTVHDMSRCIRRKINLKLLSSTCDKLLMDNLLRKTALLHPLSNHQSDQ